MTRPFVRALSPAAPAVPQGAPLVVFDGVCMLCSGLVRQVIARDRAGRFRFTPAQGDLGRALYRDLGLDPERLETLILVVDGIAYGKSAAVIEIAVRLGGPWRAAALFRRAPAWLGDGLYDLVAARRYRWFGRREACWLPGPDIASRIL